MDAVERTKCDAVGLQHGIDARLLVALRLTENGGPGREFGVLAVPAPTWEAQADVAARTIRHTIGRLWKALDADAWDDAHARYTDLFLRYFSRGGPEWAGYAPLHAENDPTDLNAHHVKNLTTFYAGECARG